jgi:alpha-ketoglutarate-dependent taurine dioxygenase
MNSPFDLNNEDAFKRWRDFKLASAPPSAEKLIVEIRNPRALSVAEHAELLSLIERCNMAIYASPIRLEDNAIPREVGRQFGLHSLDANWLADEDGVSEIQVNQAGTRADFIPYTDKPIKWHTDGYYNTQERTIRAMVLHCVREAQTGGENRLMDHEMAYLLLRDANPEYIRALMQPDAMTIPERVDEKDGIRPVQPGPVFSVDNGKLHMRYTARTRSIVWKENAVAAAGKLAEILASDLPCIYRAKLAAGSGLLCNNVLHDRAGFTDAPQSPRLLYRARYYERISGSC